MAKRIARQNKLKAEFEDKQYSQKSVNKLKLLQMPISKWKYIGLLDWTETHSNTLEFVISEIELVIVNGLGMYPFYTRLEKMIAAAPDL